MSSLLRAYRMQRNTAKARGIEWLFTFDTWVAVWESSGRLKDRGVGRGRYCMARRGDVGPYAPWNVYIATHEQNSKDSRRNHPVSTAALSQRELGRGRGWTFCKGAFQVSVARVYVGRFQTQDEAETAYQAAVAERARLLGIAVRGLESQGPGGAK